MMNCTEGERVVQLKGEGGGLEEICGFERTHWGERKKSNAPASRPLLHTPADLPSGLLNFAYFCGPIWALLPNPVNEASFFFASSPPSLIYFMAFFALLPHHKSYQCLFDMTPAETEREYLTIPRPHLHTRFLSR